MALGLPLDVARRLAAPVRDFELYPENEQALRLFCAMTTQWRVGPNGPTGFDYAALPVVEARCGIGEAERDDCFWALGVMEREALAVFRERRSRQRPPA